MINENVIAKKPGRTFRCSVSAVRPSEQVYKSVCRQSVYDTRSELPVSAQAEAIIVSALPSGDGECGTIAKCNKTVVSKVGDVTQHGQFSRFDNAVQLESIVDSHKYDFNESMEMQFTVLNYAYVDIKGPRLPVHALVDGGSQVCVVNHKIIESLDLICVGSVLIKGITGSPINCNLYKLHVVLTPRDSDNCNSNDVTIVCAACHDLNEQLILTLPVVDQLYANRQSVVNGHDEYDDVNDSSCHDDSVGIFNHDGVDATVAVTTRAQSKKANGDVIEDSSIASDVTNDDSFIDVDDASSLQNALSIDNHAEFVNEKN